MKNILIICPYGDLNPEENRSGQLAECLKNMYAQTAQVDRSDQKAQAAHYFVMVVEQVSPKKYFNRGQLINYGVHYFHAEIGRPFSIIFHDIDILPDTALFGQFAKNEKSYSVIPRKSEAYKATYGLMNLTTGSALYLTKPDVFIKANGFPNNYWGWGGEDNVLDSRYHRIKIKLRHNDAMGSFATIDTQRRTTTEDPNKAKMTFLRKNEVRNMMVKELKNAEKNTWSTNGYDQVKHLDIKIDDEHRSEHDQYTYIHLKVELDTTGLNETVAHNDAVYAELAK
jgi:hypothetical protein